MDYAKLQAEILLPVYAGKTDTEIANMLNAPKAVDMGYRALTAKEVIDATTSQKAAQISDAAALANAQGHEAATRFEYYLGCVGELEVGPGTQGLATLNEMVGKILTAADVTALQERGHVIVQKSRAEVLGLPFLGAHHVAVARSM